MTRELLVWPPASSGQDWQLRITLAEVSQDGPFSPFPGVLRRFVVVDGCGLSLRWMGQDSWQDLLPGHAPLPFDGALAPDCRLLRHGPGGPARSTDLNLMTRGLPSSMERIQDGQPRRMSGGQRGFFAAQAGRWWCAGSASQLVSAHTLVWKDDVLDGTTTETWYFEPLVDNMPHQPLGWWLEAGA